MDTKQSSTGRFRGIVGTLGAVTGLVTAVVGLIAALVSIGVFGGDDNSDETASTTVTVQPLVPQTSTTQSPVPTTVAPTPVPTTPAPSRASVTITYLGDLDGCGLGLAMTVGDRDFVPTGFSYQASSLLTGPQTYLVSGTITCPTIGQCVASGSGVIDVFEGAEFFVIWQNVNFGACDVFLQA